MLQGTVDAVPSFPRLLLLVPVPVGLQHVALEMMEAATQGLKASQPSSAHPKVIQIASFHDLLFQPQIVCEMPPSRCPWSGPFDLLLYTPWISARLLWVDIYVVLWTSSAASTVPTHGCVSTRDNGPQEGYRLRKLMSRPMVTALPFHAHSQVLGERGAESLLRHPVQTSWVPATCHRLLAGEDTQSNAGLESSALEERRAEEVTLGEQVTGQGPPRP
ncbi:unnamed protein product [Rangifer tarandus platyrhynchus]|uniref:Uncharacterized protein n=1 Tax=Rangifer tarandus platyrhynchus TaxID=3082113 RepID=A0ABN8YL51_RANTA|nr:unnamed protein product [Rangifer tarandus platyrhynchus]